MAKHEKSRTFGPWSTIVGFILPDLSAEGRRLRAIDAGAGAGTGTGAVWSTIRPLIRAPAIVPVYTQPIDLIKVRIQLGQGSAITVAKNILKNEGIGTFCKGLSARLLRQVIYPVAQFGSYEILYNKSIEANVGKTLPVDQTFLCAFIGNVIGASLVCPTDLALIRMQADFTLPAAQRRNYSNVFHALYRITVDEGVLSLWKGVGPSVARSAALNMGMIASFHRSLDVFSYYCASGKALVLAAGVSAFSAAACSLPFDYVKTQIQKMQPDAQGKYPYTGSLDCAMKTFKTRGLFRFYSGFPVYYVQLAPTVLMLWLLEAEKFGLGIHSK